MNLRHLTSRSFSRIRRGMIRWFAIGLALASWPHGAAAQATPWDKGIDFAFAVLAERAEGDIPYFFDHDKRVMAILATREALSDETRQRCQRHGIFFRTSNDGVLVSRVDDHYSYPVRLTRVGWNWLKQTNPAWLKYTRADMVVKTPPPYDDVFLAQKIDAIHQMTYHDQTLTGQGVKIGDIDSYIDFTHPALLKIDRTQSISWNDVNSDGVYTPGSDTINYLGSAVAGKLLKANIENAMGQFIYDSNSGEYEPGSDWIYIDEDSSGRRESCYDADPSTGLNRFSDTTKGLGEPIFIGADLNKNGAIDLNESFYQLTESKIAAVYDGKEYRRGENLLELCPILQKQPDLFFHGTSVAGILVGGDPQLSRFVGIAPDAEIYNAYNSSQESSYFEGMSWFVQQDVDLMNHEYQSIIFEARDGSSEAEKLIASLELGQGAPHKIGSAIAAGNLRGNGMHAEATLAPGASAEFPFTTPNRPVRTVMFEFSYLGDQATEWTLASADNRVILSLSTDSIVNAGGNLFTRFRYRHEMYRLWAQMQKTERGVTSIKVYLSAYRKIYHSIHCLWNGKNLSDSQPLRIHAFLFDDYFYSKTSFDHATETHLMAWPATSDGGIVVAAYNGQSDPVFSGSSAHEDLAAYSGPGPRPNLENRSISIAATADPVAPVNPPGYNKNLANPGYMEFGGTSGATPFVGGTMALLAQIGYRGSDANALILANARRDEFTGDNLPDDDWGYGKLDIQAIVDNALACQQDSKNCPTQP